MLPFFFVTRIGTGEIEIWARFPQRDQVARKPACFFFLELLLLTWFLSAFLCSLVVFFVVVLVSVDFLAEPQSAR